MGAIELMGSHWLTYGESQVHLLEVTYGDHWLTYGDYWLTCGAHWLTYGAHWLTYGRDTGNIATIRAI